MFGQMLLWVFWNILKMRVTFESVGFERNRLSSLMWVDIIQSAESINRKKRLTFLEEKETLPADCLWTQTADQFPKRDLSLSLSLFI